MPLLGAHLSIAGGYHNAAEAAGRLGMDTLQIFTKSNAQWRAKPITDEEVAKFRDAVAEADLKLPCAHASYLINLGTGDAELWRRSVDAFAVELQRAESFGLAGVVLHPGVAKNCDESAAIENVIRGLDEAVELAGSGAVEVWLETTAGQGACLGHRFEHLGEMLRRVQQPTRFGICLDTCHVFAAGYALETEENCAAMLEQFDELVGLAHLRALHLNDSKKPCGSRVDRHEHIGEGLIGALPFRILLNDSRLHGLPMYMETPKGQRDGEDLDAINLRRLRSFIADSATQP